MTRVIVRERLPYHSRLGRNVNHDSESRRFAIPERDVEIRTVQHKRYVPIYDQGQLGSCTGNAGDGCTGTGSFYGSLGGAGLVPHGPGVDLALRYGWNEDGAVALYSRATVLDPYSGDYPPEDTGSDGLSVAKALKEAGEISGYLWSFTPATMRAALMSTPLITGITWLNDMFNPDDTGQVSVSGAVAGGHEIVVAGYDMVGSAPSNDDRVWFDNSWGDWGAQRPGQTTRGSFWMTLGAYSELLSDNGDVTQFVANTEPAPTPTPDPDNPPAPTPDGPTTDDRVLWVATSQWTQETHTGQNKKAAKAVRTWAKAKGLR